ncbi:J domain-containing protein [Natrinema halophilum]|uniref:DnaJ domain-containing protein n=1 Tax=Natrinema halophilum TaxID=1699371 RepID=A0A7D5GLG7_9EURY|nr:DnaJ domain-containing protein [Natrinema halophilum]QLG47673.1 DnaJ domain-containing protein [Natrinema halophilum]
MGETYYEVLGVDPDATRDDIESAYRERVLETHPDHSDVPDAAERFQRVTKAKSILIDGAERARYDRLGHEAYVELAQGAPFGGDSTAETAQSDRSPSTPNHSTETGRAKTTDDTDRATDSDSEAADSGRANERNRWTSTSTHRANTSTDSVADDTGRKRSHHARHRSRQRTRTERRRSTGEWPFGDTRERTRKHTSSRTTATDGHTVGPQGSDGFQYSVHGWDDEISLEWDGPPIDQSTAITVGSVALLYPVFVAASLTPLFSVPVNAIVAACTLALIGYVLTMPRIAMVVFGTWSVLFPTGMVGFSLVDLASSRGLFVLAFAWVPLGYAVALWWTLRP